MGLGFVLLVAPIVLTVIFVVLTEASPGAKATAVIILVAAMWLPGRLPESAVVCVLVKTALAVAIAIYLKIAGLTR